jgi:glycosyltransferase involved in cell wall biosynthesis
MEKIVCLSTSNYHPYPTRKQNVMNRLNDAQILYFDPPVTYLAPLKDKNARPRLKMYKKAGERPKDNLTVYALPPVLPFGNKYRFINRLNQRKLARYINLRLAEHGFAKPHLWCYSPTSADILAHIDHKSLIYDCVDRHSAYTGFINAVVVDGMERDLTRAADMVFCTAQGLFETLSAENPHTVLIPNGAAYELFSRAAGENLGRDIAHPVFGFVGMLQDCIAYDYLLALADAFPTGEIRLIGKVMPGVDVSVLKEKNNIKFLGLMPQSELPEQMHAFDVCLNIFAPGRLAKDVSPLKFYEYLATGKPVVSTREPLQVSDYADIVYIADNIEEFISKCRSALSEDDLDKVQKRMQAGKAASWDNRVNQMEKSLREVGIFA